MQSEIVPEGMKKYIDIVICQSSNLGYDSHTKGLHVELVLNADTGFKPVSLHYDSFTGKKEILMVLDYLQHEREASIYTFKGLLIGEKLIIQYEESIHEVFNRSYAYTGTSINEKLVKYPGLKSSNTCNTCKFDLKDCLGCVDKSKWERKDCQNCTYQEYKKLSDQTRCVDCHDHSLWKSSEQIIREAEALKKYDDKVDKIMQDDWKPDNGIAGPPKEETD